MINLQVSFAGWMVLSDKQGKLTMWDGHEREVKEWLNENIGQENWSYRDDRFQGLFFANKEAALAFKLTFPQYCKW